MSNTTNPLVDELITFIQHDLPGLPDGEYELKVDQRVNDSKGKPINDDTISNSYQFAVLGDRFSIKTPTDIYSTFPADNDEGEYSAVLPHVVFTNSKLPWTRYPTTKEPITPPPPGSGTDANVPTWLTVLLLDEDDLASYPKLTLPPTNSTIGDLFPPAAYAKSTLADNYSYFEGATDTSGLEIGELPTDTIQTLDIPLELFWKIAPTVEDLSLLAHVRRVSFLNKATIAGVSDVGNPEGDFSIVFGNRLPQAQKRTFACLVSLEELQPFLPDSDDGGPPSGNTFDGKRFLRLAVLRSWRLFSTGQPATFRDQLLELNGREASSTAEAENTNLRLTYSGDNLVIKNALDMGYVPLDNNLRTGGKTVSWYRGPLVPYSISEAKVSFPISSPDQAKVFDPTTGMFDLSYASAWSIGRMISLQDTSFSSALYTWKKGLTQKTVNAVEEEIMAQKFSAVLTAGFQPAALAAMEDTATSTSLFHKMIQSLHPQND